MRSPFHTEGEAVTQEAPLKGETVVVIGGSSGIGLETARLAHEQGAEVIITARDADRLHVAGREIHASIAAFDATDFLRLERFFAELPEPIDHVLVSGGGPYYAPFEELDFHEARLDAERHIWVPLKVATLVRGRVRPEGSLLLLGGTGGRNPAAGPVISMTTAAQPALVRSLALELAPVRVNLIAPGFVDTPLSARLLADDLDARRKELQERLPIGRVVTARDVANLAVHLMTNTALTGAVFDIDGGQQLV